MRIKVIGTSHIAKQSKEEIRKVIFDERPDIVCVELDAARFKSLFSKKRKFKIKDVFELGLFGFLFAIIGSFIQKGLGNRAGLAPGADMRAAILAAKKVGSKVFLIDQPLQTTLYKISKIGLWEKTRLIFYFLFGGVFPKERAILKDVNLKKVPEEQVISKLMVLFKKRFPQLYKILVLDRNKVMIKNILKIREMFPDSKILVVVGAGHKQSIETALKSSKFF